MKKTIMVMVAGLMLAGCAYDQAYQSYGNAVTAAHQSAGEAQKAYYQMLVELAKQENALKIAAMNRAGSGAVIFIGSDARGIPAFQQVPLPKAPDSGAKETAAIFGDIVKTAGVAYGIHAIGSTIRTVAETANNATSTITNITANREVDQSTHVADSGNTTQSISVAESGNTTDNSDHSDNSETSTDNSDHSVSEVMTDNSDRSNHSDNSDNSDNSDISIRYPVQDVASVEP